MEGKIILVVDDAAAIRQVLKGSLSGEGHHIIEASNGKDAIKKLQDNRVSLMITDINMPEMDGITLTKTVKRVKSYRFLPIVCLTGEDSKDFIPKAKDAGACAWIDKPFTPAEVVGVVRKLLR